MRVNAGERPGRHAATGTPGGRRLDPRTWSLARQMAALQVLVVVLVVAGAATLAFLDSERDARENAAAISTAIAKSLADSPEVRRALDEPDPSATLQPLAERVRHDTGTDFVVVMNPDRTRYSHPDPARIGQHFIGTIAPALAGRAFTEVYTGTLGPSVRAVVPIFDGSGADGSRVVGMVSVGITTESVAAQARRSVPGLLLAGCGLVLVAVLVSMLVTRRLRRATYGLGPEELSRMYRYYDAVLHSAREGLLLLDDRGVVQLVNDEARRLLNVPASAVGRRARDLALPPALAATLDAGRECTDEIHLLPERVVVVSLRRAGSPDVAPEEGWIVTVRDHTELLELNGELNTSRRLSEALQAQGHEAANRLHTVVSLLELGRPDDAIRLATHWLDLAQRLTDRVVDTVQEPVLAALLLGKSAVAAEHGVELVLREESWLDSDTMQAMGMSATDLVTIVGNLVDNAIDAVRSVPPPRVVEVTVRPDGDALLVRVRDTGPGLDPAVAAAAFRRGWSSKRGSGDALHAHGLGLALVGQAVTRLNGRVVVTRDVGAVFTVRIPLARVPV